MRDFAPGLIVGAYRLHTLIAEGGMGQVWRAEHLGLRRLVVIKTLRRDLVADAEAYARFQREGEAATRIRHPHVVEIHDVGMHDGVPFLVMEDLEGEDLGKRLARERTIPLQELAELMLPVCAAVSAAHVEGVVHRDLKPENIFLARTRVGELVPKVLDFGISRVVDDRSGRIRTETAAVLGTPRYMSPEQARGERLIDDRSDQWSLGVILYECGTGWPPIADDAPLLMLTRIVEGVFAPPRAVAPWLPAEFEAVVLRALASRAEKRFPSVRALGGALLPFAGERARTLWGGVFTENGTDHRATWSVDGDTSVWSRLPVPDRTGPNDTALDEGPPAAMPTGSVNEAREVTTVAQRKGRRRWWWWVLIAVVVVGVVSVIDWVLWG